MLGLCCCAQAFSPCGEQGLLLLPRLGSRACGLPQLQCTGLAARSEIEPVSPALAGVFLTTGPPARSSCWYSDPYFTVGWQLFYESSGLEHPSPAPHPGGKSPVCLCRLPLHPSSPCSALGGWWSWTFWTGGFDGVQPMGSVREICRMEGQALLSAFHSLVFLAPLGVVKAGVPS